jgi:hypothetical protein
MSQKISNATANANANIVISLKGLALSNYEGKIEKWETFFLRNVKGHNLSITVKKIKNGIVSESNTYPIADNLSEISITSDIAESLKPRYFSKDDMDFRKLVDFSSAELYGTKPTFKNPPIIPTTKLSISNGIFYTKTISDKSYAILKDGNTVKISRFGVITGCDIVCEKGNTYIQIKGCENLIPPLERMDDVIYEVIFDNDCRNPPADGTSDFDLYCKLFDTNECFTMAKTDNYSQNMSKEVEEASSKSSGPPHKEPLCNTVIGG